MGNHLPEDEVAKIEDLAKKRCKPLEILNTINKMRERKHMTPISESTLRRILRGEAYQRGKLERRGRKKKATNALVKKFEKSRATLLKKAKSDYRITYKMVTKHAKIDKKVSIRRLRPAVRATGVTFLPARKKLHRTEEEIKRRHTQATKWRKHPKSFWMEKIHGYIDNKSFAIPKTKEKLSLLKKQKVYGHLRKRSEGLNKECVVPKKQRKGIGVPSIELTMCVSPSEGRVVMIHVARDKAAKKKWNGEAAKNMYEKPLASALKRVYGALPTYRIVEDGDPSGYQSKKGKEGKRNAKIRSWQLPPRTPEWNPLDFSIWHTIETKALNSTPKKKHTKESWLKTLRKTAQGLSKDYVKNCCESMKSRIEKTYKAKGGHIKGD